MVILNHSTVCQTQTTLTPQKSLKQVLSSSWDGWPFGGGAGSPSNTVARA